jgi:hypothetical protein
MVLTTGLRNMELLKDSAPAKGVTTVADDKTGEAFPGGDNIWIQENSILRIGRVPPRRKLNLYLLW